MTTKTTNEIDDLRTELAGLRAEIKSAMKMVRRRDGGMASGVTHGLTALLARLAGNVLTDAVLKRGRVFERPMQRALVGHPMRAAAVAIAAAVLFGGYFSRTRL